MSRVRSQDRHFLASYKASLPAMQIAAAEAQRFVERLVFPILHAIHAVRGRAKGFESARDKLRRKPYSRPATEMTDLIGVRVITYFAADIDAVAGAIRSHVDVSDRKSRDVRLELDNDRFGYRSLHLIARLKRRESTSPSYSNLKRKWFEIQIRSILDHAWSEIEHETAYKSEIDFPDSFTRRFRAVAGALEVIEDVFVKLAEEQHSLIESYKIQYALNRLGNRRFDVARLIAYMETRFPDAPSLRSTSETNTILHPNQNAALIHVLQAIGAHNASRLRVILSGRRFTSAVGAFAAEAGSSTSDVSHRARLILAAALERPTLVRSQFPELLEDPVIARIARISD